MDAKEKDEARTLQHDLGNCLHRIALQAALLKKKVPSNLVAGVQTIQDECKAAAALLERLRARAVP